MRILITGSAGMLGKDLVSVLAHNEHDVIPINRKNLDITNYADLEKTASLESPEIIINCAAYTNIDAAEDCKDKCYQVNVTGVQNLVKLCREKSITLMQISTDYVFDGKKDEYMEDDNKAPINYYGKTKSEAEDFIMENLDVYYIVRTAWLYGHGGKNFVKTIQSICHERSEIKVVYDQVGSPTYTKDLSRGIVLLLKKPFGVYHLINDGSCSWFEFAKKIVELEKTSCGVIGCTSKEYPRKAARPKYSILLNTKAEKLRHWEDALQAYFNE